MNEHVLAAARGWDESITLGWIEPLHRTFSHSRRLRGIKKSNRAVGPRTNRHARGIRIRGLGQAGERQPNARFGKKVPIRTRFPPFWRFYAHLARPGAVIRELGNWFDPHPVDVILPLAGRPRRACDWHIAYGKPRPRARRGFRTER